PDAGLLGLARRRRRPRPVAAARADQLREGPARAPRARLAGRLSAPLPKRAGRFKAVSALELAGKALQAAEGDEALALVQSERSGMARFAGSEVHQPTLIENETVELQVVRDGRLGIATGNRTDDDGPRAPASRAAARA